MFGEEKFERLAGISASHIYNLRRPAAYRKIRVRVQHTPASKVSIGERRQPDPKGRPGYLRVDTVHQGHHDGEAGVYHLNAVDTVTQWEVVGGTETISEQHLMPSWRRCCISFPFGMPADDVVEYWEAGVDEPDIAANFRLPLAREKAIVWYAPIQLPAVPSDMEIGCEY